MGRTNVRLLAEKTSPDYAYYRDKGWLESDYNYPVRLNIVKKAAGGVFDFAFSRMAKR